ncbi:substrate-binding domain-containing protein [Halomonas vilamensis]|uniref:Substrate-binding domain-containing protein n=1 Tax=Vreelandella vilamensis TaxID=531309 RepID=A0ABU1H182_9GAMM|nr:substrate-binding domain-containing protein [Halomonas vilamensis]MDR5897576.1 substrate-binding domain-containing protein [Halomonas vilamensis]
MIRDMRQHWRFSFWFLTLISCLLWPATTLLASQEGTEEKTARVGFAQDTLANDWRLQQVKDVEAELAYYPEIEFVYTNANESVAQQALHIRQLAGDVDVLVVSPRVKSVLSQVIADVHDAGVPVILVDRGIDGPHYTSFIRPNNTAIGRAAAQHLVNALDASGTVLMLEGVAGASVTQQRAQGFTDVMKRHPNIHIVARTGNFLRADALRAVQHVIEDGITFDAIFAQSDSMATGARMAMVEAGLDLSHIPIIGIDYIEEAKAAILDGTQSVSFTYPTGGKEAAELAVRLLRGESVPKNVILPSVKVTIDNVKDVEALF